MWKWSDFFFPSLMNWQGLSEWVNENFGIYQWKRCSAVVYFFFHFSRNRREKHKMNKRWNAFFSLFFLFFPVSIHKLRRMNCSFKQILVQNRPILRYVNGKAYYARAREKARESEIFSTVATNWHTSNVVLKLSWMWHFYASV